MIKIFNKIHKDGYKFIIIALVLTILTATTIFRDIFLLLLIFFLIFFRNPDRKTPIGNDFIISPGDGIVKSISSSFTPKELIGDILNKDMEWTKISIFLSVFDVHVNRIPTSGQVIQSFYKKGLFKNAMKGESSDVNESQYIVIKNKNNDLIITQQIAGLIARRIVCYSKVGDDVASGQEYGIIRFGSRMDVYVPSDSYVHSIKVGEFVKCGETIIAQKENLTGKIKLQ